MEKGPLLYALEREAAFSYACHRCGKCCHHQRITLAPYEILRLARNLEISTGEFIARHTVEGGTILRFEGAEGACSLLKDDGCSVHADRPLACRLYPLGGSFSASGPDRFALLQPHPESAGVYGTEETVGQFVDSQAIGPYLMASSRYVRLFELLLRLLARYLILQTPPRAYIEESFNIDPNHITASYWLDVDAVLTEWCAKQGLPFPESLEEQVELHLEAMRAWADGIDRALTGNDDSESL